LDHADPTSVAIPAQVRHFQPAHSAIEMDSSIVWRAGNRVGSSQILQSNKVPGARLSATFRSAKVYQFAEAETKNQVLKQRIVRMLEDAGMDAQ